MQRLFVIILGLVLFGASPAPAAPSTGSDDARAHWLKLDLIAWDMPGAARVVLMTGPGAAGGRAASVHVLARAGSVDGALAAANPHLTGMPLFRITGAHRNDVRAWLKGPLRVAAHNADGSTGAATGLQIGGVLDDLYANDAALGVHFTHGAPTISVWAPTAVSVRLHLFGAPGGARNSVLPMMENPATGVWRVAGTAGWNRQYYLFEVRVFVPAERRFVTNFVTDPYSLNLAADSKRSQIVDLDDPALKPGGWAAMARHLPDAPEDRAIYELHVRDFSASDATVPAAHRGRYLAFTDADGAGMRHLRALAEAGLSDIHLLPTYDCATIPERAADRRSPPDLSRFPADSDRQQAAIAAVRDSDGYNWCYDPYHYLAAEGSYASTADGPARIVEFRQMVQGLSRAGLGTILDVVFNHTVAAGQAPNAVLDRIVPGYYHRLDATGAVARSTCCANTASERAMMEKLMIDALIVWARDYKVSGFRFDLMGHHSRATILKAQDRLRALTLAGDGVDGAHLYLYGEGWNFGEVADDARFIQASQKHMGEGTGIGTFNDRFRDAVRGGGAGDSGMAAVRAQGFASGLFTAPNADNPGGAAARAAALVLADHIRVGLAGSIAAYRLRTADGSEQRAGALAYGSSALGYVSDPQETINYAEAHDNQTLFDSNALKLPRATSTAERVRWQNIAASLVILAQGVPFLHAGQEMLRSKSLDRNSHDSGDWFNLLDFSMTANGWGRGLPPRADNTTDWPIDRVLLVDPRLVMAPSDIARASDHVREMLMIRRSSSLFRLRTADDVIAMLRFENSGPDQVPGLIVEALGKPDAVEMVVIVNATRDAHSVAAPVHGAFHLHPLLASSSDRVVRGAVYQQGRFVIPALTTAVFVADTAVAR